MKRRWRWEPSWWSLPHHLKYQVSSAAFRASYKPHDPAPWPRLSSNLRVPRAKHKPFAVFWPGFPCCLIQVSCSQTQVISYQTIHTFPSVSGLADDMGLLHVRHTVFYDYIYKPMPQAVFNLWGRNLNSERWSHTLPTTLLFLPIP